MRAARLHEYDETLSRVEILRLEEVPTPKVEEPDDVIVRIGGAGLCRSDLHIIDGSLRSQLNVPLPIISATKMPAGCMLSARWSGPWGPATPSSSTLS